MKGKFVMNDENMTSDELALVVQDCLKEPPMIIWGSGATVPCGLPRMSDLGESVKKKKKIQGLDVTHLDVEHFEEELGKEEYQKNEKFMEDVRRLIWLCVHRADHKVVELTLDALKKAGKANSDSAQHHPTAIHRMMETFMSAHPRLLNIVTTNYDRVLEYVAAVHKIPFSDGTTGRALSSFDQKNFVKKDGVNIIKVHGSLSWFTKDGRFVCCDRLRAKFDPCIIIPGRGKYKDAFQIPYRELLQQADAAIAQAKSFFAYGFGFHDEHVTPEIRKRVQAGVPIVVVAKDISTECIQELSSATKYVLIAESFEGDKKKTESREETRVRIRGFARGENQELEVNGSFWKLSEFMDLLNRRVAR